MNTVARKVAKPSGHSPKMMSKVTKMKIAERQRKLKRAFDVLENICEDDKTFKICKNSIEEIMLEPKTYNLPNKRMTYSYSSSCAISPLINKKNDVPIADKTNKGYDLLGKRISYEQRKAMLKIKRKLITPNKPLHSPSTTNSFKFDLSKCQERSFSFSRNESTPEKNQQFIFDNSSINFQKFMDDSKNIPSKLEINIDGLEIFEKTIINGAINDHIKENELMNHPIKATYRSAFQKLGTYQPNKESVSLDICEKTFENILKFNSNELLILNAELAAYYQLRPLQGSEYDIKGRNDICYNPLSIGSDLDSNFFKPI